MASKTSPKKNEEWITVNRKKPVKDDANATFVVEKKKKREPTAMDQFIKSEKKHKVNYDKLFLTPSHNPNDNSKENGRTNGFPDKPHKKPKPQKPLPQKRKFTAEKSFENEVRKVSLHDIQMMMTESKTHFPDTKSIWLKDVAAYLNTLVPYEVSDPLFNGKPDNYPSCLLKPEVVQEIKNLYDECTSPTLQLFHEFCIESITKNMGKLMLPTAGFLMAVQILAESNPDIGFSNVQRFVDARTSWKSRNQICLSLMWMSLQSIRNDTRNGLRLWYDVIYPLIGIKPYTDYSITILESCIKSIEKSRSFKDVQMSSRLFFELFDFILGVQGLSKMNNERLRNLLQSLEHIVIEQNKDKPDVLFVTLLTRLNQKASVVQKEEVLSFVKQCVKATPQVIPFVCREHKDEILRIAGLLETFSRDDFLSEIPKEVFSETLGYLRHASLDKSKKGNAVQLKQLANNLDRLRVIEKKMGKSGFPWKSVFIILLAVAAATISVDIQKHGSFKRSVTGQTLARYGVIDFWNRNLATATVYGNRAFDWLSKTVPIYWKPVDKVIGPYLLIVRQKASIAGNFIWDSLSPVRSYVSQVVPPLFDKIHNDIIPVVIAFFRHFWSTTVNTFSDISLWVNKNVLTGTLSIDNISKATGEGVTYVQTGLQRLFSSISQLTAGLTK